MGKPKGKRQYQWAVEPLDSATNKVIANWIGNLDGTEFEARGMGAFGNGLAAPKLIMCPRSLIERLRGSRAKLDLRFRVWVREGNGEFREWKFPKKSCSLRGKVFPASRLVAPGKK